MKKILNKKMMMGISSALVIGAIAGCIPVYAEADSNYNESKISTTTTSETDADGNITDTTVIVREENGKKTESKIVEWTDAKTGLKYLENVPITIANDSDIAIDVFNVALPDDTDWGNDYILEGVVLQPGDTEEDVLLLTVLESGCKFDLRVVDVDGLEYVFDNVELSDISREGAVMSFEGNKEEGYALSHTVNE